MSKILGNGKPTNKTPGIVGQEYIDKLTGTSYICTEVKHTAGLQSGESDSAYAWEKIELNHTLIGEVVLTNENCTYVNECVLGFNMELQSAVRNIFDQIKDHIGGILVNASVVDATINAYAAYLPPSSMNLENLQFITVEDPTENYLKAFSITETQLSTAQTSVCSAVQAGYPLTIKVYTI